MRKFLIACAAVAGLGAVGVGAFAAFFDFDKVLNEQKDKYLPELEKLLGRKVTVGEVKTKFLPVLGASLNNIQVQAQNENEAPLVKLPSVMFEVELWTAIKSLGKDLKLKSLVINGLDIDVVRHADGSFSFDDIINRLASGDELPEEEQPKPLDPEVINLIKSIKLNRVALENASLHLKDESAGEEAADLSINKLLVELKNVALSDPFDLHMAAAVFANEPNFDLKVLVGPIPFDNLPQTPIDLVELKSSGINLATIMPYLGKDLPVAIASAQFTADMRVQDPLAIKGPISVKGGFDVKNISISGGEVFDLGVHPNLTFDPNAGNLDLTGFALTLGELGLFAEGKASQLMTDRPSFDDLKVHTENFKLERILAMVPDVAKALPPNSKINGELTLNALASGDPTSQDFKVQFNLDPCEINLPGMVTKSNTTPMHLMVDAHLTENDLDLKQFEFQVSDLKLGLAGTVKQFDNPTFDLSGGTDSFSISNLVRLLPSVSGSIPNDVKVAGNMQLGLLCKGNMDNLDAHVTIGLAGADLEVPGTTIKGGARFAATASGNPSASLALGLDAELRDLTLIAGDAFKKQSGQALDLHVSGNMSGDNLTVPSLSMHLASLALNGSASMNTKTSQMNASVEIPRFNLTEVSQMVPSLAESPIGKATLGMNLSVSGNTSNLQTVKAALKNFYFGVGSTSLAGEATVENLDAPKIRFNFNAPNFVLEDVVGASSEPVQEETASGPIVIPEIVKVIDANGQLTVARGSAAGFPFQSFKAAVDMKNGIFNFTALELKAYEGQFSADKITANLAQPVPSFDANLGLRNVSIQPLLKDQAGINSLSGKATATLALSGKGLEWDTISKNLSGNVNLSLKNGKWDGLNVTGSIIDPIAKKIPQLRLQSMSNGLAFNDLDAQFGVKDGKATLKSPMTIKTGEGPLTMNGYIGLDESIELKGSMDLQPSTIKTITFNQITVDKAVPVGLTLGGTISDPGVKSVDVEDLATALMKGALGGVLDLDAAKAEAAKLKAKAEAEAKALADKAKAEAEKAKKAAEDKAKKEAEKAKEKAKDKAKDALKKIF